MAICERIDNEQRNKITCKESKGKKQIESLFITKFNSAYKVESDCSKMLICAKRLTSDHRTLEFLILKEKPKIRLKTVKVPSEFLDL